MAVDWNSYAMVMWKEEAVRQQQDYCDWLGTPMWRQFKPSDYKKLKREIGFALFGPPEEEPFDDLNDGTGYTAKKLEHVNKIFLIIKKSMENHKDHNNVCVSFLFVSVKEGDECTSIPIIRIPKFDINFKQNINIFIDVCGRVYEEWPDYLENNTLPNSVLCYPRNGVYSAVDGVVQVEFGISPAGQPGAKLLQKLDNGGSVLGFGATGVFIAALFMPVAWPVFAGATSVSMLTGCYTAGRSIQTLVDRKQHQQSIGLGNAVSRNCWLGIGSGLMGIASGRIMVKAAKTAEAGAAMTVAEQVAVKSVSTGSCFLNAVGVTNALANIIEKAENEEKVTHLDIFQLTSSLLFFTNSVITRRQAVSLVSSMRKESGRGLFADRMSFRNQISQFLKRNNVSEIVSPIIVGSPILTTTTLISVCSWVGRKLIEITKSLWKGLISTCDYLLEVGEILGNFWDLWNNEIAEVADKICQAFGLKHWSEGVIKVCTFLTKPESGHMREMAGTLIAEKRSLLNSRTTVMPYQQENAIADNGTVGGSTSDINNLSNSRADKETQSSISYEDGVINILSTFAYTQDCKNPADFLRYMTFVCKFVKSRFQKEKSYYEKMWEIVKDYMNVEDFNKRCGISGDPNNHFLQNVFKEFESGEKDGFTLLKLAYDNQNSCRSAQEECGQSFFDVDGVTFLPFYSQVGLASNGFLSKEQLSVMAAKLTGQHADTNSIYMSASGATAVIQANAGVYVIMIQCWLEYGKVSGIATAFHSPSE